MGISFMNIVHKISGTSIQRIGFLSWVENCETMPAVEISYGHEAVVKPMFLQIAQYKQTLAKYKLLACNPLSAEFLIKINQNI